MNNKSTMLIIFLLVVGLISAGFLVSNIKKTTVIPEAVVEVSQTSEAAVNENVSEENTYVMETLEMPENAITFDKFEGTVTYKAQKEFFKKNDEEVVGITEKIRGESWLDIDSNSYYLKAEIDFTDFATDNEKRDSDILKLFITTEIKVETSAENDERIVYDEEFVVEAPIILTINGVSRSELFEITATLSEEEFSAAGATKIRMSDFGVITPNLENVFSVEDEMTISFDVVGSHNTMLDAMDEVDQE